MLFTLQGDQGDEDRVKLNLINLARQNGTLKRTETDKEIRFRGMTVIDPSAYKPSGKEIVGIAMEDIEKGQVGVIEI